MTPFNARVTDTDTFTVPNGKVAEFHAFGQSLMIDGVMIVDIASGHQAGPLVAPAGAVISTASRATGISGYLKNAE